MKRLAIALCSTVGLAFAVTAAAEPTARDLHAAECVAALDLHTQELARQVKAGKESLRPLLLDRLVAGAAFVGDSYLHGDSDEEQARALAEQARQALKTLSPSALAARQAACAGEGAKLHASGNALQRAVVKRLAKNRMGRLLEPPKPGSA